MITLTQDSSKTKPLCLPCPCCSLSPCPSLLVSGPTVELLCDAKAEIDLKAPFMNLRQANLFGQTSRRLYQLPGPREERTGENVVSAMSVVSGVGVVSEWWV